MIFAELPLDEAEGAILAYSTNIGAYNLRKGMILGNDHVEALRKAGYTSILAARLEPDDIGEDEAALLVGNAITSEFLFKGDATTGRVNLFAAQSGLLSVQKEIIDRINRLDDRISIATLRDGVQVDAKQMVAAIKIIPFAVPHSLVREVEGILHEQDAISIKPYAPQRVGLVQTRLATTQDSVLNKTAKAIEHRLSRVGSKIGQELRAEHQVQPLKEAIAELHSSNDLILIFGASAVCDAADVLPEAIRQAGGEVLRIGIPVDPGNLLVLGQYQGKYIVGAPGTARGSQETSLDWVLDRLLTNQPIEADDLAELGVGGLLITSRPT